MLGPAKAFGGAGMVTPVHCHPPLPPCPGPLCVQLSSGDGPVLAGLEPLIQPCSDCH